MSSSSHIAQTPKQTEGASGSGENRELADSAGQEERRVKNLFLGMNGPGLNGTLSAPSSRGIFSGDQPSVAKQQIVSKRDLRVPKFSKKAGYPRSTWRKKMKFFTSEAADALDYDSDTVSRATKKKYNNVMLRALVEAGDDDEQFFNIVDAATEVLHATYKTVLAALDKFYGRGVVTELVSVLLSLIKFSTDTETDPITRLTKFDERQSKVMK